MNQNNQKQTLFKKILTQAKKYAAYYRKKYHNNKEWRKQRDEYHKRVKAERNKRIGIYKKRFWTEQEVSFLKSNYNTMTIEQIAISLKRSWSSIVRKANRLKLKKHRDWKNYEY